MELTDTETKLHNEFKIFFENYFDENNNSATYRSTFPLWAIKKLAELEDKINQLKGGPVKYA
jgi:hypothetical protein